LAEDFIGLFQREDGGLGAEGDLGGEGEELAAVGAGVGGDAAEVLLVEEVPLVVQRRDLGDVDAGQGEGAAGVEGFEGGGDEVAGSGGRSVAPPAQAAPSSRASACWRGSRVMTYTVQPQWRATWMEMWAEEPKP
jgi:hypothetical protein